jgi:hypothetical protein
VKGEIHMPWYLWIVTSLIFLLLFISFTKIKIHIYYLHEQDNDQLVITFKAWLGLITYKINVPLMKVDENSPSFVYEKKKENKNGKESNKSKKTKVTPDEIKTNFEKLNDFLQRVTHFHKIVQSFLRHVSLDKIVWHSQIGVGDAAQTGTIVGVIWGLKGSIYALLTKYLKVNTDPVLSIYPLFQMKSSQTRLECMISFRIGHSIVAAIKIVKYWKGGRASWDNIQLKA